MKDMDALPGLRTCAVFGLSGEADAGAEMALRVAVEADPPTDLAGLVVEIADPSGTTLATAPLALQEDEEGAYHATDEIPLRAPESPGPARLVVRLAPHRAAEAVYPATEAEVAYSVTAHSIAPVVWGVPQAVAPGADFAVRIGARCGSACDATGWEVAVRDDTGRELARGVAGPVPWPGTEGLRYAELTLTAPDTLGLATWEAVVEAPGAALPHLPGSRRFGVRTTPPADARLRVEAVEAASGAPVAGLKVVVHPFAVRTGADGTAEIALPSGRHRVFVSGKRFIPHRAELDIEGETRLRVALEPDEGLTDQMLWG